MWSFAKAKMGGGGGDLEAEIKYRTVQSSYRDCLIVKTLDLFLCDF